MVSFQRLRKKLVRLGVLEKDISKCKSIKDLNKLKEKFDKENVTSNGSDTEGE